MVAKESLMIYGWPTACAQRDEQISYRSQRDGFEGKGSPPPPKDYQQLYLNVRNKPLVVHDVTVKGNDRTKPGVFDKVLAPIYAAQSLDELRIRCLEANAILNSYAIFDRVDILCDAGPANAPDSASVVVEVTEKNKVNLHGGAYVSQSGEGSAEFSAGLNNALGYGEKLDVEMLQGHEKSSTYGLAWAQPRVFNNDVDVTTRVFQQGACWAFPKSQHCLLPLFECTTSNIYWQRYNYIHHIRTVCPYSTPIHLTLRNTDTFLSQSQVSCSKRLSSFDETARGVSVTATGGGPATLAYELVFREINDPTRLASKAIRHQLGHSLKSSVAYSWVVDTRDRVTRPTCGALYRFRSELSGIGLDSQMTKFFKQEIEAQTVHTPTDGVTLSMSAKLGFLKPLGERDVKKGTCVADRFFLGGVGSLRGFDTHGVGPSDERRHPKDLEAANASGILPRDQLGGDVMASLFLSAQLEPSWKKLREIGAYAHAFVNAGTLVPFPSGDTSYNSKINTIKDITNSARLSVGVGLVFPLPVGNVEVNYVRVARAGGTDRTKNGLQIGLATALAF